MADLDLSFTLKDGKRWKEGRFEINGLDIMDTGDNYEVIYDDIELFVDGKPYDGSASNWAGQNYDVEQIFDQVLSGYLMNDGTYTSFSDDWSIFTDLESLKMYQGDLLMKFPVYRYGEIIIYELGLATPNSRYYTSDSGDEYMMLDNNNELVTDMENFFMEAFDSDLEDIEAGELDCLYMSDDVQAYLDNLEE